MGILESQKNIEMEEEEHEVYGGEILDVGEMEGDLDSHYANIDMAVGDNDVVKVFYSILFLSVSPHQAPYDMENLSI